MTREGCQRIGKQVQKVMRVQDFSFFMFLPYNSLYPRGYVSVKSWDDQFKTHNQSQ